MLPTKESTQINQESIMKRFHVHVAVEDLDTSIRFYSKVFGIEPTVRKPDYAKWMMEDPRMNFAISQRGAKAGIVFCSICCLAYVSPAGQKPLTPSTYSEKSGV